MQVFKTALRVFFRHPIYLAIYVLWLGCMGLFMGLSLASTPQSAFFEQRPDVAVIDRDESALSEGLADFISQHAELVAVDDDERALQDATAQNLAAYIVIIPQGFGEGFLDAARDGGTMPTLDTVVSYESYAGPMMDNLVNGYLGAAFAYVASATSTDGAEVSRMAAEDLATSTDVSIWRSGETDYVSSQYRTYMMFSVYPAMLAIIICIAVVMRAFNQDEVKRRGFASSASSLSMNLQIALACLVIALIVWVWIGTLGLAVFGGSLEGVGVATIVSGLESLLVFCLVALALGFLVGQLARSELVMNAVGNILGLILSFLGGTWIPLDLVGEPMATIARLTPTYYYGDALSQAYGVTGTGAPSADFLADLGIMALFALAIFAVALAVGRQRRARAGVRTGRAAHDGRFKMDVSR